MLVTPSGILIFFNFSQFSNAPSPMFVTEDGISITINNIHPLNTSFPINSNLLLISSFCYVFYIKG